MTHQTVEKAVLDVYRRVSPSYREIGSAEAFARQREAREAILHELGLPPLAFRDRRVVDVGGGTGENSLFYALWGAEVTLTDPNEISLQRAAQLFEDHGQGVDLVHEGLFDLEPGFLSCFDVVLCEGVVHHTYDPLAALDVLAEGLRPGALLMVALGESHGWHKRELQRRVVRRGARDEAEIIERARRWFGEHLERAVEHGFRSEESVIYDTYVNPQIRTAPLEGICDVLARHDVFHLAAYPSLAPFPRTTPWNRGRNNLFDYDAHRGWYTLLERVWTCSGEEDAGKLLRTLDLDALRERLERETSELEKLQRRIETEDFEVEHLRPLQRGYLGLGMNYFCGVKR